MAQLLESIEFLVGTDLAIQKQTHSKTMGNFSMDESFKDRLTSGELWTRALYMILFAIAYGVAELVVTLIVIFQFFAALFTGRVNEPLLKFGRNLATYINQIIRFETFNSEVRPFPFSDWPDDPPESGHWLGERETQTAATAADQPVGQTSERTVPEAAAPEPPAPDHDDEGRAADDPGQPGDQPPR
jgi:hypothetical protein